MGTNCSNYFPWKMRLLILFVCGNVVFSNFIQADCHTFCITHFFGLSQIYSYLINIFFSPKIPKFCGVISGKKKRFIDLSQKQTYIWNISANLEENFFKHHAFHVMNFEVFMMYCTQLWYGVNIRPVTRILELLRKVYLWIHFNVTLQELCLQMAFKNILHFWSVKYFPYWFVSCTLLCRMQQMRIPLYSYN